MGFSKQEYWSGLPCPPPGDLPNPRIEPNSLALAGGFFTTSTTWEALYTFGKYSHHPKKYNHIEDFSRTEGYASLYWLNPELHTFDNILCTCFIYKAS